MRYLDIADDEHDLQELFEEDGDVFMAIIADHPSAEVVEQLTRWCEAFKMDRENTEPHFYTQKFSHVDSETEFMEKLEDYANEPNADPHLKEVSEDAFRDAIINYEINNKNKRDKIPKSRPPDNSKKKDLIDRK